MSERVEDRCCGRGPEGDLPAEEIAHDGVRKVNGWLTETLTWLPMPHREAWKLRHNGMPVTWIGWR